MLEGKQGAVKPELCCYPLHANGSRGETGLSAAQEKAHFVACLPTDPASLLPPSLLSPQEKLPERGEAYLQFALLYSTVDGQRRVSGGCWCAIACCKGSEC